MKDSYFLPWSLADGTVGEVPYFPLSLVWCKPNKFKSLLSPEWFIYSNAASLSILEGGKKKKKKTNPPHFPSFPISPVSMLLDRGPK